MSTGTGYKTKKPKKLHKKLRREPRKLSRKCEENKSKLEKGEATKGIEKQKSIIAKIHHKIANARGMMKNRYLSKDIANQDFNTFIKKESSKPMETE